MTKLLKGFLNEFDIVLNSYIKSYRRVHGRDPGGRDLERIVHSAFDDIQHPRLRALTRTGLKVVKLVNEADGSKTTRLGFSTKHLNKISRLLDSGE